MRRRTLCVWCAGSTGPKRLRGQTREIAATARPSWSLIGARTAHISTERSSLSGAKVANIFPLVLAVSPIILPGATTDLKGDSVRTSSTVTACPSSPTGKSVVSTVAAARPSIPTAQSGRSARLLRRIQRAQNNGLPPGPDHGGRVLIGAGPKDREMPSRSSGRIAYPSVAAVGRPGSHCPFLEVRELEPVK
jgi:hypothetical protein